MGQAVIWDQAHLDHTHQGSGCYFTALAFLRVINIKGWSPSAFVWAVENMVKENTSDF